MCASTGTPTSSSPHTLDVQTTSKNTTHFSCSCLSKNADEGCTRTTDAFPRRVHARPTRQTRQIRRGQAGQAARGMEVLNMRHTFHGPEIALSFGQLGNIVEETTAQRLPQRNPRLLMEERRGFRTMRLFCGLDQRALLDGITLTLSTGGKRPARMGYAWFHRGPWGWRSLKTSAGMQRRSRI